MIDLFTANWARQEDEGDFRRLKKTKMIVEEVGGQIDMESSEGHDRTIRIRWPKNIKGAKKECANTSL